MIVYGRLYHNLDAELQKGAIKLVIQDNNVVSADWSGLVPDNLKKFLKQAINVYRTQTGFEWKIASGMVHGDVSLKIFWPEKKMEINVSSKITKDH